MKAILGAMLMISAGCAAAPPTEDGAAPKGGGSCDAAPTQKLVGRSRSRAAGAEARRLSGAAVLRWIPDGTMVTMEYREDRLSIWLDAQNRILRINCG